MTRMTFCSVLTHIPTQTKTNGTDSELLAIMFISGINYFGHHQLSSSLPSTNNAGSRQISWMHKPSLFCLFQSDSSAEKIARQQKRQLELDSFIEKFRQLSDPRSPNHQREDLVGKFLESWKILVRPTWSVSRAKYSKRMNEREINSLLKQTWLGK